MSGEPAAEKKALSGLRRTAHERRWRSFGWSNNRRCRHAAHWRDSAFRATASRWYAGTAVRAGGLERRPAATGSRLEPTPCATTSSSRHLTNRGGRRATWRSASPTARAIFSQGFGLPPAEGARDEDRQNLRHAMA
jgi:hypothetical protein